MGNSIATLYESAPCLVLDSTVIDASHRFIGAVMTVRAQPADSDLWARVTRLATSLAEAGLGVTVVDDGSELRPPRDMIEHLRRLGGSYLRLDTGHRLPSAARPRNAGAVFSNFDYVLMLDPALSVDPGFADRLRAELRSPAFHGNGHAFAMMPQVALTPRGQAYLARTGPEDRAAFVRDAVSRMDPALLVEFSVVSSACAYHRHTYLARGGCDERFEGSGHETLELNCRMIQHGCRFPIPEDWPNDDGGFDTTEYRGWRSAYRLAGDRSWAAGLFVIRQGPLSPLADDTHSADQARFRDSLATPPHRRREPDALPDAHAGRTLLVRTNRFTLNREIRPLYGALTTVDPNHLPEDLDLRDFIAAESIDRIVFHNPYCDVPTRRLYDHARAAGLPFLVAERGGLNDSLFYDANGFLADSDSYARPNWDREPSAEEAEVTRIRIAEHRRSRRSLEAQNPRLPLDDIRRELNIRAGERILFAPLQRPSDTATRFFARGSITYERHLEILAELSAGLPLGWRLLCKRHPLEDKTDPAIGPEVDHFHVSDLLELSDAVLTFNSGVGLQALLHETPVLVTGRAYYSIEGVTHAVASADDVILALEAGLPFDTRLAFRFLNYLINRLYSFGDFRTKEVRMPEGHRMTVTRNIRFRELRAFGRSFRYRTDPEAPEIGRDSPLFDRFRRPCDREAASPSFADLDAAAIADVFSRDLTGAILARAPRTEAEATPKRFHFEDEPRPLEIARGLKVNYKPQAGARLRGQVLHTPGLGRRFGRLSLFSEDTAAWLLVQVELDRAILERHHRIDAILLCRSQRPGRIFTALHVSYPADRDSFHGRSSSPVDVSEHPIRSTFALSGEFWKSVTERSTISFAIGAKEVLDGFTVTDLIVLGR